VCNLVSRSDNVNDEDDQKPLQFSRPRDFILNIYIYIYITAFRNTDLQTNFSVGTTVCSVTKPNSF